MKLSKGVKDKICLQIFFEIVHNFMFVIIQF